MEQVQNELYKVIEKAQKYDKLIKLQNGFDIIRCSFCGNRQNEVEQLIAGNNVYICNECIEICVDVIVEKKNAIND